MNKQLLQILQHTLGLDEFGRGTQYRNHFVTGERGSDFTKCTHLTKAGLMENHGQQRLAGGMYCFSVTKEGKKAVVRESPKPPKLTRSQKRYQRYLEWGDCFDSFRDFLRWDGEQEHTQ